MANSPDSTAARESRCIVRVRFSEVDSLRIVWHGHYLKYFEEAREAFGREHGLSYLDIEAAGLVAPIVHASCDYLLPAKYGDEIEVVARFIPNAAPKIEYRFEVRRAAGGELLARGRSVQALLNRDGELLLVRPELLERFYLRYFP